ncbi:MAG: hypothetical protein ABJJ48_04155, partial [Marinomonas sp.]
AGEAPEGTVATNGLSVDLRGQRVKGSGGISGTVPSGTFSANSIDVDMEARTIILDGNARLRMVPGKLRIPQKP